MADRQRRPQHGQHLPIRPRDRVYISGRAPDEPSQRSAMPEVFARALAPWERVGPLGGKNNGLPCFSVDGVRYRFQECLPFTVELAEAIALSD